MILRARFIPVIGILPVLALLVHAQKPSPEYRRGEKGKCSAG